MKLENPLRRMRLSQNKHLPFKVNTNSVNTLTASNTEAMLPKLPILCTPRKAEDGIEIVPLWNVPSGRPLNNDRRLGLRPGGLREKKA